MDDELVMGVLFPFSHTWWAIVFFHCNRKCNTCLFSPGHLIQKVREAQKLTFLLSAIVSALWCTSWKDLQNFYSHDNEKRLWNFLVLSNKTWNSSPSPLLNIMESRLDSQFLQIPWLWMLHITKGKPGEWNLI